MRFLGLGLADPVPDANTIWSFRETLTRATLNDRAAIEMLFLSYEAVLTRAGFLAMGGQIIDASIVAAPKQRTTDAEKREIKAGVSGRMEGQARQVGAERPGGALDREVVQGQTRR